MNEMRTRWYFISLTLLGVALLLGCGRSPSASNQSAAPATYQGTGPLRAVTTVGMVADLVRNVGGSHVETLQLLGSGVDPHLYKATRDDVETIMEADIVFYSGLMLEGKMVDTLVKLGRTKPVYAVTEALDQASLLEPAEFAGHYDPHVWMDASAWSNCIDAVAEALATFDPMHAADYRANAQAYRQQLDKLYAYGKSTMATVPPEARVLLTSHDAFNYFGRAYGLDVQGVQGLSTDSEAGLQRINELVDLIVQRKVKAVFVESSVPRKNIEAIVAGARARGHEVVIGGELYSDAMGEPGTYEGTYIGMLDHNITLVTRALGGEAPPRGLHGKLAADQAALSSK
jgi:manganese/zinc/iron transport system substrate-binding protein